MVLRVKITEDRSTINDTSTDPIEDNPTLIGQSDKKDYTVKLTADPEDISDNIIGLRLYLGCHKVGDNDANTSNCRLSVIRNHSQHHSAIDPINPCSDDKTDVLRYVITDKDVEEIIDDGYIKITVQLETSQNSAIDRTPIIMNEVYVLEAHIEYALKERIEVIQCSTQAADASIHFEVIDQ